MNNDSEQLYYVQNVERSYVSNSVLWWKWNDNGYVVDVRGAKKFTEEKAKELCEGREKFKMFPCEYIEALVQHHIDIQDLQAKPQRTVSHTVEGMEGKPQAEGRHELRD